MPKAGPRTGFPRPPRNRGVTLVELLVVMSMMAALATISYAGIKETLPMWRINTAARMVRGDLLDAKVRAVKNMREIRVTFTSDGYTIDQGNARVGSTAWTPSSESGQVSGRNFQDEGQAYVHVDTTSSDTEVIFRPSGVIDPTNGNLEISILNEKGEGRVIQISMAGRIRIES